METGTKKDNTECLLKNFKNRDNKINLEESALTFNKHFISIAENPAMSYLNKHFIEAFPTMNLLPVTESEITSVINNIKLTYSSGYDGVTNKVLKLSSQLISKPMTYIINKSLSMGVYPERLQYAIISPICKKGDKTYTNNYRPISLLTGFAKYCHLLLYCHIIISVLLYYYVLLYCHIINSVLLYSYYYIMYKSLTCPISCKMIRG
jgi:hypothetical protein